MAGRILPGTGTGIALSPSLILTNDHVVAHAELIGIQGDEVYADVHLLGGDPALDIALLETDFPIPGWSEPTFGASSDLFMGQPVFVIGYPLGIGKSIASGVVSGLDLMNPLNTQSWTTGFLVETVEPGSAADRAGLRGGVFPVIWGLNELLLGGDVIVEVNGMAIDSLEDALSIVSGLAIGEEVALVYWRDGEMLEATVILEKRPFRDADLWAGMRN